MANRFQCSRCNTSYDADAIMFVQAACGVCGALLDVPPPKPADSAAHPESRWASTMNPPLPKPKGSTKTRRKKSLPLAKLLVLAVIAALAFGSYRFIQHNKRDQQTTANVPKAEKPTEPSQSLRTDVEPQKPLADSPRVNSGAVPGTPTGFGNPGAVSMLSLIHI